MIRNTYSETENTFHQITTEGLTQLSTPTLKRDDAEVATLTSTKGHYY